ncbi:Putative Polycomb group protein asxl2 [Desmophyllum pertusum]|uniref:Polycomb group protein asxl2 n=1 Tax=Desmophyllum pertusum TaxID=174260 RepID=A0A9W9Z2U6_9CNID|nr:Putative Polycomb group protein asxl2 [Desmophyllum pertusum]
MSTEKDETKRKKGLTWAEAAKQVLERSVDPLTHKDILRVIQDEGLRDLSRGTAPLACLNAMLHHHSRGPNDLFIKVEGRMSCYKFNPNSIETLGENSAQDSDSDLMEMADDPEFNMFLDKDSINGPHLNNGKVKLPMGTNDIVMPQLKPPPPNPPPRDPKPKVPLTKDGRLQKKRGPKPGPRQTANKRPRLTSSRTVPKMVLKNLKVGTVESGNGANGKNGSGKVKPPSALVPPSSKLIPPSSASVTANAITSHSFPRLPSSADGVDGKEKLEKFSDLWTTSKPRRYKKMSVAAQLKRTKEGRVDIQSPDSILTSIPLRSLINQRTFNMLPPWYQYQLVTMLPRVDKSVGHDGALRPSHTAFTNEFFASACHSWKDRLQDGDFMTDMHQRMKQEEERLAKLDPWKAKFFEPVWGKKNLSEDDSFRPDLAHAYFTAPLSPAPASSPRSTITASYKDSTHSRSQFTPPKSPRITSAMIQPLTVPVQKLPSHCLPKRVTESRRSESAKQLRANARPPRQRSIPIFRMVTVAVATEALKAVRTSAPPNMLTASTVYAKKRTIKTPCSESASGSLFRESTVTPISSASILSNDAVELRSPASLIKPRPPSRAAMRQQAAANRDILTRRGSAVSGSTSKGGFSSTVVSTKNFSRSMLLKSCSCRLKAMEVCRKCGAFCHDDCISAAQLCNACVSVN